MDNAHGKIVIRPEDLAKPDSPAKPFTITPADVEAERVTRPATQPAKNAAQPTPARSTRAQRNYYRVFAFLLVATLVVATLAVVLYFNLTNENGPISASSDDWIEQIASRADRSVVRIESQPESLGTGFVIASSGTRHLILTNKHVITNPDQCRVVLRSGHAVAGTLAGLASGDTDLALLVVDTRGLAPLGPIGKFGDVRTGQKVVAIGHPLGLDFTVTDGIVSAKRGGLELQTSAPISPGNSGGPLVTQNGTIIGVNTRIIDPSEGQSLGFSIRADLVLETASWSYLADITDLISRIQH